MSKHIFKDRAAHVPDFCRPTVDVIAQFSGKWAIFVMGNLNAGPRRFSELEEAIPGISQRMLTLTLRTMERDGLVSRTVTPSIPPRVDYELTQLGRELLKLADNLHNFVVTNRDDVLAARERFDTAGGEPVIRLVHP